MNRPRSRSNNFGPNSWPWWPSPNSQTIYWYTMEHSTYTKLQPHDVSVNDSIYREWVTVNTVTNTLKRRIYVSVYQIFLAGVQHKGRIIILYSICHMFWKSLRAGGQKRSNGIILESAAPWTCIQRSSAFRLHSAARVFVFSCGDNHGNLLSMVLSTVNILNERLEFYIRKSVPVRGK